MNQRVRGRIIAAVVSVGFAAGLLASGGSIVLVNAISAVRRRYVGADFDDVALSRMAGFFDEHRTLRRGPLDEPRLVADCRGRSTEGCREVGGCCIPRCDRVTADSHLARWLVEHVASDAETRRLRQVGVRQRSHPGVRQLCDSGPRLRRLLRRRMPGCGPPHLEPDDRGFASRPSGDRPDRARLDRNTRRLSLHRATVPGGRAPGALRPVRPSVRTRTPRREHARSTPCSG